MAGLSSLAFLKIASQARQKSGALFPLAGRGMGQSGFLIIDNHDFFTYRLLRSLGGFGAGLQVVHNNETGFVDAMALVPSQIAICRSRPHKKFTVATLYCNIGSASCQQFSSQE